MNRIKALLLVMVMLLSVVTFAACGEKPAEQTGNQTNDTQAPLSAEAAYKVSVVDAAGNPFTTGIAVKFLQGGTQVAMQLINEAGMAEKTLTRGNYTVELQFTDPNAPDYVYDAAGLTLSAEKTELQVILSQKLGEQTQELSVGTAYYVLEGCTNIPLSAEGRSYYIFVPKAVGKYEISLVGSDAPIGYFGGSIHYIWDHSAVEPVENKFAVNIKQGQLGGAVMIIGVDAGEGDAILSIQNIGEPDWSVEDEPWTVYQPTGNIAPYTLPAGATLNKFDLTASTDSYNLVLNETDGYYHLNSADGPLVLAVIGNTATETDYVPPFETILEKQGVRRYFFDENGQFLKKEEYSDCTLKYIENVDEASGTYPLTADLMYIIQQHGIQAGWFDETGSGYLFKDKDGNKIIGINNEISWLFMCRYL